MALNQYEIDQDLEEMRRMAEYKDMNMQNEFLRIHSQRVDNPLD